MEILSAEAPEREKQSAEQACSISSHGLYWTGSSTLPRLHQGYELILPRLLDGGVLFPEQGEPDAHHALAEALRSLADTADALRRLAEVLETPSQNNHPPKESHRKGTSTGSAARPT